ncbi:MAG: PIN domain-containing protein [Nitrososphaerota archaeon]|jgi:predicted nucleic acid-binding protein|nr:PIN domain-containing protein [Nitrososphaerota archaeon]
MRLYLEPSVLVKLFKREDDSDKMIEIISRIDKGGSWSACTSRWSFLEVARALKKDGKPKELIELNLREMRSHRVEYKPVSLEVLAEAERIVLEHNVYASDSVHAATYRNLKRASKLDVFLTDDKHFLRLRELVDPRTIRDIVI